MQQHFKFVFTAPCAEGPFKETFSGGWFLPDLGKMGVAVAVVNNQPGSGRSFYQGALFSADFEKIVVLRCWPDNFHSDIFGQFPEAVNNKSRTVGRYKQRLFQKCIQIFLRKSQHK